MPEMALNASKLESKGFARSALTLGSQNFQENPGPRAQETVIARQTRWQLTATESTR